MKKFGAAVLLAAFILTGWIGEAFSAENPASADSASVSLKNDLSLSHHGWGGRGGRGGHGGCGW